MAYFLDNYPISVEGANLILTEEQEKSCRVVYKLSDDENDRGAYFAELWNPDKIYSDKYVILPLKSTGGKKVELSRNDVDCFANVIGSTKDSLLSNAGSWIKLWMSVTKQPYPSCCTDGNFYYTDKRTECRFNKINVQNSKVNAGCSMGQVNGGHIIINAKSAAAALPNSSVYIVPLCTNHNIGYADGYSNWGAGFYMKLNGDAPAVELISYLSGIRDYIEIIKKENRYE